MTSEHAKSKARRGEPIALGNGSTVRHDIEGSGEDCLIFMGSGLSGAFYLGTTRLKKVLGLLGREAVLRLLGETPLPVGQPSIPSDDELHLGHLLEVSYGMVQRIDHRRDSAIALWLKDTRKVLCRLFPTTWQAEPPTQGDEQPMRAERLVEIVLVDHTDHIEKLEKELADIRDRLGVHMAAQGNENRAVADMLESLRNELAMLAKIVHQHTEGEESAPQARKEGEDSGAH